jgi:hypothetical protein
MGYTGYCVDSPKLTHLRNVSPQSMPANSRTERAQALEKERKRQKTCFELFGEFRSRFLQILGFVFKPMARKTSVECEINEMCITLAYSGHCFQLERS